MHAKPFHATRYVDSDNKNKIIPGRENDRELTDSDKDAIISAVGRCFAEVGDAGFSDIDAEVTRKLLCDSKHNQETLVVKIMSTTGNMMEALAGVMILSSSTVLMKHNGSGEEPHTHGPKTFKVCNLVQLCISPEFNQRGLGYIGITALSQLMKYCQADFLWWCGTKTKYYDKYLYKNLYKKNPKMINCPFNLRPYYEEENRNSFYYMQVTNKFQDLTKWYNEDPDNRYFSFQESNEELRTYHNINSILDEPITHTFKEKLPYDYVSYPAKHIFEIKIKNKTAYKNFKTKLRYGSLEVYGHREDTMGNTHKYAETFPLNTILRGYKLKQRTSRYDGENFVITIHYK